MTCSQCKYQFCWLCGGKYSSSHYDFYNVFGCPGLQHYSSSSGLIKRSTMRILLASGLVVGIPIGGVVAIGLGVGLGIPAFVIGAPILGIVAIYKSVKKRRAKARRMQINARRKLQLQQYLSTIEISSPLPFVPTIVSKD